MDSTQFLIFCIINIITTIANVIVIFKHPNKYEPLYMNIFCSILCGSIALFFGYKYIQQIGLL